MGIVVLETIQETPVFQVDEDMIEIQILNLNTESHGCNHTCTRPKMDMDVTFRGMQTLFFQIRCGKILDSQWSINGEQVLDEDDDDATQNLSSL